MSDLRTFSPKGLCPKCGHDRVDTKHTTFFSVMCLTTYNEALRRTCRRCEAVWDEACIDGSSDSELRWQYLDQQRPA